MTKIAYLKCLCTSAQRQLAISLKNQGYKLIITDNDKSLKDEALKYGKNIPFIITDGIIEEL